MPVQTRLELATFNDLLNLTFSSSVEGSSPFDHNLFQPPIHAPLFISSSSLHWVTASLVIYSTSSSALIFHVWIMFILPPDWAKVISSGTPLPHPTFPTHFLWDMLIYPILLEFCLPCLTVNSMRLGLCLKALLYPPCLAQYVTYDINVNIVNAKRKSKSHMNSCF